VIIPLERLALPELVDGSNRTFRAPFAQCLLDANNDHAAINAWLSLHEAWATHASHACYASIGEWWRPDDGKRQSAACVYFHDVCLPAYGRSKASTENQICI